MGEAKETVEWGTGSCSCNTCRNDFWGTVEGIDEDWRKQDEDDTDCFYDQAACQYAKSHTFAHAVIFSSPEVLGNESGHSHGEGSDRQEDKTLHLGIGTDAGNDRSTEGVVVGLDQDIGKVNDTVLHGSRYAKPHNFREFFFMEADF